MAAVPKLIILSEQLRGKGFELTKDLHTCGRVEERDICIKDPTISSHHCDFIKSDSTYILRDNGSTNGTRVNNVPVTEQELQNSDILQVGGVEVLFDCDDKSVTTVMRTQTGINLDDGDNASVVTVRTMDNFDPFKSGNQSSGVTSLIIKIVIVVLILLIVGLIGYLLFRQSLQPSPAFISLLQIQ